MTPSSSCAVDVPLHHTPGAPWERDRWLSRTQNCSCNGTRIAGRIAKFCSLPMPSQRLPPLHIASPVGDVPAYPAYEIDRGTYGTLRTVMRSRRGGQQRRFIDIGANLGTYSIALALANPDKHIWMVHQKGKHAAVGDTAVRTHMRGLGFIDSKTSAISDQLTTTRYRLRKS